jgi:hypothetical protein
LKQRQDGSVTLSTKMKRALKNDFKNVSFFKKMFAVRKMFCIIKIFFILQDTRCSQSAIQLSDDNIYLCMVLQKNAKNFQYKFK